MKATEPRYPQGGDALPKYSASSIETYRKCPRRYFLDREIKHRRSTVRMSIGVATHVGAALSLRWKTRHGEEAPAEEVEGATAQAYDDETQYSEFFESRHEIDKGKDAAVAASGLYVRRVAPLIEKPIVVEKPIIARVADVLIVGRPDVIEPVGVGDLKTGRPWDQKRANRTGQLTQYGVLNKAHLGEYPRRLWIDSIWRRGEDQVWNWNRFWTVRTDVDYAAWWEVIRSVHRGITAGVDSPAPEDAWWCSKKYCPHWTKCKVVAGRRTHE